MRLVKNQRQTKEKPRNNIGTPKLQKVLLLRLTKFMTKLLNQIY